MDHLKFLRIQASKGGRAAARNMSKAQRMARARKAAEASARVRSRKARERQKGEKAAAEALG